MLALPGLKLWVPPSVLHKTNKGGWLMPGSQLLGHSNKRNFGSSLAAQQVRGQPGNTSSYLPKNCHWALKQAEEQFPQGQSLKKNNVSVINGVTNNSNSPSHLERASVDICGSDPAAKKWGSLNAHQQMASEPWKCGAPIQWDSTHLFKNKENWQGKCITLENILSEVTQTPTRAHVRIKKWVQMWQCLKKLEIAKVN